MAPTVGASGPHRFRLLGLGRESPSRQGVINVFHVGYRWPMKVEVDPNSVSRLNPDLTPVLIEQFEQVPERDEYLRVSQPEEGEPDYVGHGWVEEIDEHSGLVYVRVAWDTFEEFESDEQGPVEIGEHRAFDFNHSPLEVILA